MKDAREARLRILADDILKQVVCACGNYRHHGVSWMPKESGEGLEKTVELLKASLAGAYLAAAQAQCLCCGELKDLWHSAEYSDKYRSYIHRSKESGKFGGLCDASKIHALVELKK